MFCNIPTNFEILSLEVRLKCCYEDRKDSTKKPKETAKKPQRYCKDTAKKPQRLCMILGLIGLFLYLYDFKSLEMNILQPM